MIRRLRNRRAVVSVCFFACVAGLSLGLTCPFGGAAPYNPAVPSENRSPRVVITSLSTPKTPEADRYVAEPGDPVTIAFSGEDAEDIAVVRVFASTSANPSPAQEIPITDGYPVGPGVADGTAVWSTTGVTAATYYIFAEIDDRTYNPADGSGNPAVRTTSRLPVEVAVPGTKPLSNPPKLEFIYPRANLGLSSQDEVTIRYQYNDLDTPVRVTLLLDTDRNPTNDDIDDPGDPLDPNTKIIILPSTAAQSGDPDVEEIRTNPRDLPATTSTEPWVEIEYRFTINFDEIPVRTTPYYFRATISDETNTIHTYAEGQITISSLAQGTVDMVDLGFGLAGARFHGFSEKENLGSSFVGMTDLDGDGPEDFMIAGRFASPRNRFQSGAAYLVFGRRKTPFPADTNGNGLPDTTDANGNVVDFAEPPAYYPNPYDPSNVGRFGGTNSINSVGTFFRGTTYAMPEAHDEYDPPATSYDPDHALARTAGLVSIARVDMNYDTIPDFIFGLPFISSAWDHVDVDPAEGCGSRYIDDEPQSLWCASADRGADDLISPRHPPYFDNSINQGIVIVVNATNNISENGQFAHFVDAGLAGQHDPSGALDDEGVLRGSNQVPSGMRFRGGWFDEIELFLQVDTTSDCCEPHDSPGCEDSACEDAVCAFEPTCCSSDSEWSEFCSFLAEVFCDECAQDYYYYSDSEFGMTVSDMPNFDNDGRDELLISSPGYDPLGGYDLHGDPGEYDPNDLDRGRVEIWLSDDFLSTARYATTEMSLPSYTTPGDTCTDGTPAYCLRTWVPLPISNDVLGQQPGDRFGFARAAGDVNQDGTEDVLAGAPGADRNGLVDCGVMYVLYTPSQGFGNTDLSVVPAFPRIEIHGTHSYDRFGLVQTGVRDVSNDTIDDIAFSSEFYDVPSIGTDAGYVGVIFGDRPTTGEIGFSPEEVGTSALPGVRFYGAHAGAKAGHDIASAGDFNGDGIGDLLITSPGERRQVQVQSVDPNTGLPITVTETRVGVAYLIFGGQHLVDTDQDANVSFKLTEVGTTTLPGIVFISRFAQGTQDEAPIETAAGIGDIDGDGFDDIILGAPHADFIYSSSPDQRRLDAGEAYIVYGSNYGSNRLNQ